MFSGLIDILKRVRRERDLGDECLPLELQSDQDFAALLDDLAGLGKIHVPAAARERTWAQLRGELRKAEAGAHRPATGAGRPWRLGTAAAGLLMAAAVAVGVYVASGDQDPIIVVSTDPVSSSPAPSSSGGGASQDGTSSSTEPGGSVTSETGTSISGDVTSTQSSDSVSTTGQEPGTTKPEVPTEWSTPPASDQPGSTSPANSGTTRTTAGQPRSTTTERPATTTSDTVLAKAERESSARSVAGRVADAVIRGDHFSAVQFVSPSGSSGLTQMMASLSENVYGYHILTVTTPGATRAKVLIEMMDYVPDGQGGREELRPRFMFDIEVEANGAVVTGIYDAGSGE